MTSRLLKIAFGALVFTFTPRISSAHPSDRGCVDIDVDTTEYGSPTISRVVKALLNWNEAEGSAAEVRLLAPASCRRGHGQYSRWPV